MSCIFLCLLYNFLYASPLPPQHNYHTPTRNTATAHKDYDKLKMTHSLGDIRPHFPATLSSESAAKKTMG